MNRVNSCRDTFPFLSVSISFNISRASASPAATPRSLAAKAGVDTAPTTSVMVKNAIFANLNISPLLILLICLAFRKDTIGALSQINPFLL
jgi:hypothetical protein